ncbi:MFS transporter [Nesterenkonia ebinurensis]|uniref:MFS transporter n=1 Tax=Nesterenkonia ebinurensis TaxID=2608252 RepID=UPI00123CB3F7|nr:MFS transporter [Nesterenkonia ebinurensis]
MTTEAPTHNEGTFRIQLSLISLGVAVFTQIYAIQGVLPEVARDLDITPADAALTMSFATSGIAVGVLPWAWAGDRFGRLQSMLTAVGVSTALGLISPFSPNLEILLCLRFLTGATMAGVPVLTVAYVRESFSGRRAATGAGAYVAGMAVGGASGRVIAGPLGPELGWRGAIFIPALVGLLAAMIFVFAIPKVFSSPASPGLSQFRRLGSALRVPQLWILYLQALLVTGVFITVYNYLGFRVQSPPFSLSSTGAALLFLAYFSGMISSRFTPGFLTKHGHQATLLIGALGMFIGLGGMLTHMLWLVACGLVLYTACFFVAHGAGLATLGEVAEASYRSQASALFTICFYIGASFQGWVLGIVFERYGWSAMSAGIAGALLVCLAISFVGRGSRSPSFAQWSQ